LQEEEQEEEREAEHASSAVGLLLLLRDRDERLIVIMSNRCRVIMSSRCRVARSRQAQHSYPRSTSRRAGGAGRPTDRLLCQKRPTIVSKETYDSVKRDLR
jgi:hypothetical protein